ncbi:MAG: glycosyltransferase family 2 protein [Paludibacteraceae bacterium]|nr:glycosyltransferase family 2 protein [Paludibacteraceae bacterium]
MRFSIIIPVYNSEDYLQKTLDSICQQDFSDFEIICINDGSVDSSRSILIEYKKKYHNIILYDQPNSGPSVARNKGLELATGEYVLFCDSDDWFERITILSELNNYLVIQNEIIDVVYFPGNTNWGGNIVSSPDYEQKRYKSGWEFATDNCIKDSFLFFGAIYAYAYRLEVIRNNSLAFKNDIVYGEDRIWVFDFLDKAHICIVYSKPCYFYNVRQNSLMTASHTNKKKWEDSIAVSEYLWTNKFIHIKTNNIRKYIASFYFASIRNMLREGFYPKIKLKFALLYSISSIKTFVKYLILCISIRLYKQLFL